MSSFEFKNDNVKITSLPGNPSQDGTDATGVNQPTGGIGIRGWLSGIYNLLFSGSAKVQLTGSKIAEQKKNTDADENNILTFSESIYAIEIYHEEEIWQDFIINGITLTFPAGFIRSPIGGTPNTEVTIPSGISCIVRRLI